MTSERIKHKNNFNFLRLLFASFVIISHSYILLREGANAPLVRWIDRGPLSIIGVNGFFIISGFLILQSLFRANSIKQYLRKRIYRIVPGLWVVIFLSAFVLGALFSSLSLRAYFQSPGTWWYWLYNTFLIPGHYTLPGLFTHNNLTSSVNGSLWTLRYEFSFYALLILVGIVAKRLRRLLIILACVASLTLYFLVNYPPNGWPNISNSFTDNFSLLGWYFSAGSLLFLYKDFILKHKNWWFCLSAIVYFLSLVLYGDNSFPAILSLPLLIITFGHLYFPFLDYSRFTGDISYGTYIYAFPIQQVLIGYFAIQNPSSLIIAAMLLSWLFGYLSWHLVEKPFLKRIRR